MVGQGPAMVAAGVCGSVGLWSAQAPGGPDSFGVALVALAYGGLAVAVWLGMGPVRASQGYSRRPAPAKRPR